MSAFKRAFERLSLHASVHTGTRKRPTPIVSQALKNQIATVRQPHCGRHSGTRKDLPESNLCSGRSGCILLTFLALRGSKWHRHCRRAAPKRRGVGLHAQNDAKAALWPSLRYTERPARVQFMLGQVGLYSDDTNTHNRPDSSRPQAARSRVACAKRRGSRTAARSS